MENAQAILVIILATFLAVSLILSIILLQLAIRIARRVDNITERAEHIAESASAASEIFQKAAAPLAIGKLIGIIIENITAGKTQHNKGGSDDKENN
jgi:hypothetical protein